MLVASPPPSWWSKSPPPAPPQEMPDYARLVFKHIPSSDVRYTVGHPPVHIDKWFTHYFHRISFTMDVLGDENLHQVGHAVRLKSARYPDKYVVMVGGQEDNRGFDPYDDTIHEGSYLVYYGRGQVEAHGNQMVTETVGFEYKHIGFKLAFSPYEADSLGTAEHKVEQQGRQGSQVRQVRRQARDGGLPVLPEGT